MQGELYIEKQVVLKQRALYVNDSLLFIGTLNTLTSDFFEELYRFFDICYPRFYKMDKLSKTLFLASEALLKDSGLPSVKDNWRVAMILQNSHSSIDTDKLFQATIHSDSFFPSPSLFIYTLPNIALGEVAIRNRFMGENCTFVVPKFDARQCVDYVSALLNGVIYTHVICGWFDYIDEREEVELFLISKEKTEKKFNINNLEN